MELEFVEFLSRCHILILTEYYSTYKNTYKNCHLFLNTFPKYELVNFRCDNWPCSWNFYPII